ncbi:MFS transporter, partial [Bacillus cereus group sp. BC311]|uniref:MFS transporter n=1 Tax=Bacillus cereus group sp. BC311 TaxID=3445316 RepID=UPI003F299EC5
VARHQRRFGRRRAFQLGLLVAMGSTALCAWAASSHQFWWLVAATVIAGYYNANAALYRFAATELVAPAFKERAISWVLAGGILGAVVGPNLA